MFPPGRSLSAWVLQSWGGAGHQAVQQPLPQALGHRRNIIPFVSGATRGWEAGLNTDALRAGRRKGATKANPELGSW